MKPYCLLLILLWWAIPLQAEHKQLVVQAKTKRKYPPPSRQTKEPQRISLADFEENPFGYELSVDYLITRTDANFRLKKEVVANVHNPQRKDTIFSFSNQQSKLKIYKSEGNELLFLAVIADPQIELRNQIKIGMNRKDFMLKFHGLAEHLNTKGVIEITSSQDDQTYEVSLAPTLVKITNIMGTSDYSFVFKDNALTNIYINVYLD